MIGPIAGSSDSISDLKALLEIAADPKKLSAALKELESIQADTRRVLDEKAKLELEVDKKLKVLEKEKAELDKRVADFKDADVRCQAKAKFYDVGISGFKEKEKALADAWAGLNDAKAELEKAHANFQKLVADEKAEVAKELAKAEAIKAEFEEKAKKIKAIIG